MIEDDLASIPHKNTFRFDHFGNQVVVDSDFDSGNLGKCVRTQPYQFSMWTATDCEGTQKEGYPKSWFYFSVNGYQNTRIQFNIHRIHVLWALLKTPEKYRPVVRVNGAEWKRLEHDIKSLFINSQSELVLSFEYWFRDRTDRVEFAYTYPYTYEDCQRESQALRAKYQSGLDIFFRYHRLTKSVESRNIDMMMISSHEGKDGVQGVIDPLILKEEKVTKFRISKPIVMITARVHPLETPSSLCMNGIIDFLMNATDARAYFLRKYFVFVLVPMLNPDGVARGHCRMDVLNQNLNRYYKEPTIEQQPSCYAIRKLAQHYNRDKRLFFYLDLHAHPANKGNFVFGNAIYDFVLQVQSTLFPKLLSHNCINFQFDQCNFSRKHMKAKDRFEDMNKEGCGRVVLYKEFGIIHSYTLECGYHSNTSDNQLSQHINADKIYKLKFKRNTNDEKIYQSQTVVEEREEGGEYVGLDYDPMDDASSDYYRNPTQMYTQRTFNNLGKNILTTILDIWGKNPYPRVADPNDLRKEIANNNRKLDRFKKEQSHLKTKQKNIVQLIQEQYYGVWLKRNIFSRQLRVLPPSMIQRPSKITSLRKREQDKSEVSKEIPARESAQPRDQTRQLTRDSEAVLLPPQPQAPPPTKEVLIRQVRLSLLRNTDIGNTFTQRKQVNIRLLKRA